MGFKEDIERLQRERLVRISRKKEMQLKDKDRLKGKDLKLRMLRGERKIRAGLITFLVQKLLQKYLPQELLS